MSWMSWASAISFVYLLVWIVVTFRRIDRLRTKIADLEAGSLAPGWWCPKCGLFNGDVKVRLEACRGCDGPRP